MWLPAFKYIKKFAKLGQFQLPDGTGYQGAYTVGPDGVARTGDIPSVSSKVLKSIDIPLEEGPNDNLGQYTSEKIVPTPEDYEKGFMLRYFIKKDTSDKIVEVSKTNYGKYQAKGFIKTCILKWILTKPTKDIFNSGYLYKGSITRNKENTKIASNEVKGLDKFITEYDKFIEVESDVEGYKFEELTNDEKVRIIKANFSNLQSKPRVKPKSRFGKTVYPHMMYNPVNGFGVRVKNNQEHEKYTALGWVHEKPTDLEPIKRPKRSTLRRNLGRGNTGEYTDIGTEGPDNNPNEQLGGYGGGGGGSNNQQNNYY